MEEVPPFPFETCSGNAGSRLGVEPAAAKNPQVGARPITAAEPEVASLTATTDAASEATTEAAAGHALLRPGVWVRFCSERAVGPEGQWNGMRGRVYQADAKADHWLVEFEQHIGGELHVCMRSLHESCLRAVGRRRGEAKF